MPANPPRTSWQALPLYVACYAIWLALAALGIWLVFELRVTLFELAVRLRASPWQVRAFEQFGVVTLGLVWLVAIIVLEDHLRRGVAANRLWRRSARVLVFAALSIGLCYGLRLFL